MQKHSANKMIKSILSNTIYTNVRQSPVRLGAVGVKPATLISLLHCLAGD